MTKDRNEPEGEVKSIKERAGGPGNSESSLRRAIRQGHIEIVRLGPAGRRIGITDAAWARYLRSRRQ